MVADYKDEELDAILADLGKQRAPSRVHAADSRFSTAATIIAQDISTGKLYIQTAANTEHAVANGTNICAERLALGMIESDFKRQNKHGTNGKLVLKAVFVQGAPNSLQVGKKILQPNYCKCCYKCIDALMRYASEDKNSPTMVHLVPTIRNTAEHIEFAKENIISYDIRNLVAPILPIDLMQAFDWDGKKVSGICHNQDWEHIYSQALKPLRDKFGIESKLPPITGDISDWMKAALQMEHAETKWVTLILASVRHQLHGNNLDLPDGKNVQHVETAIAQTTNNRFLINSSVYGRGLSRTDSSLYKVTEAAFGIQQSLAFKKILGNGRWLWQQTQALSNHY